MQWRGKALAGMAMLVAGALFALLQLGVLLIADCSELCQARGEQVAVAALLVAGVVVAAAGGLLLRRAFRERAAHV